MDRGREFKKEFLARWKKCATSLPKSSVAAQIGRMKKLIKGVVFAKGHHSKKLHAKDDHSKKFHAIDDHVKKFHAKGDHVKKLHSKATMLRNSMLRATIPRNSMLTAHEISYHADITMLKVTYA